MVQTHHTTVQEFLRFIALPENDDRRFEYIEGEIVEVVTNNYCSLVAARMLGRIIAFVEDRGLGYVMGEAGGYQVGKDRYIPDVMNPTAKAGGLSLALHPQGRVHPRR